MSPENVNETTCTGPTPAAAGRAGAVVGPGHRHLALSRAARAGLLALLTLLLLAGCGSRHEYSGLIFDDPDPAGEIRGTNYDGAPFALSELRGELALVFFGYTYCPDVCPFTLVDLADAYRQIGETSPDLVDGLNVVFVSVDPERDTPDRLAEYMPAFAEEFYGVYVEPEALAEIKTAYGVYSEKRDVSEESAAGYLVDHSAGLYLIDREGNWRGLFKHDTPVEDLVTDLEVLLAN